MISSNCRSCKAVIVWMKTRAGKNIPVDASSCTQDDMMTEGVVFRPGEHVAHFATCPAASKHRKRK